MIQDDLNAISGIDLSGMPERCSYCDTYVADSEQFRRLRVCPKCDFHHQISNKRYIATLVEQDSFNESPPLDKYSQEQLDDGSAKFADASDAVITGTGRIMGVRTVIISLSFNYNLGSMGILVGEKITRAFEWSMDKKLPCVAIVTSGGGGRAREGVLALLQMVKTVGSARQMARHSQPYIALLGNPCTGAAYVSFVAQADIILAEPGARIGFASAQYLSEGKSSGMQKEYSSEAVARWGQIDNVVSRVDAREEIGRVLGCITGYKPAEATTPLVKPDYSKELNALKHQPTAKSYLDTIVTDFVSINRLSFATAGNTVICGFGKIKDSPAAVVAVNTEPGKGPHSLDSAVLHKIARLARLADKFTLPLVILVDSCFPAIGLEHERQGIAKSLSRVIATLGEIEVPTLAILIGDVGSEATLAVSIADHIIMLSTASYILNTSAERVDPDVEPPTLTADECLELGIIDHIIDVPEQNFDLVRRVEQQISEWLESQAKKKGSKLVAARGRRFRNIDESHLLGEPRIKRQWDALQVGIKAAVQSLRSPGDKSKTEQIEE